MGKLTKQQQQLLAMAILFIFGGGYVYLNFMLKPTLAKIRENKTRLEDLIRQIEQAEQQAKRLPQLQAEYAQLQLQLETMEKQLPTDKDIPGVLRIVTREAMQENLAFVSLKPNDPRRDPSNFFDVLEFEVQMNGPLQAFVRFMASLGQQERIFQFERLSLTVNSTDTGLANLSINFLLKTYAYAG